MSETWSLLIVSLVVAIFLWFGLRLRRAKRQTRLRVIADQLQLTWLGDDYEELRKKLADFRLFSSLNASRSYGVFSGWVDGYPVTMVELDYGNFVNGGFNPYLVLVFEVPENIPTFWLHPRGSLNTINREGSRPLDQYSDLALYILQGADPGEQLLTHFARLRSHGRWPSAAARGMTFIYYEPLRSAHSPALIQQVLDDGGRAFEAVVQKLMTNDALSFAA